jgi:hypothetical protein
VIKRTKTRKKLNVTGAAILRIRNAAHPKITQEDMVGRLASQGLPFRQSAVAKIEAGHRWVRDYELVAFAKALRVPIQVLFEA